MCSRTVLDGDGRSQPLRDSIPGPSSSYQCNQCNNKMSTYVTFVTLHFSLNVRGARYDTYLQQGGMFQELNKAWFFTMTKKLANLTYFTLNAANVRARMHCSVDVISFATYLISLRDRTVTINSVCVSHLGLVCEEQQQLTIEIIVFLGEFNLRCRATEFGTLSIVCC